MCRPFNTTLFRAIGAYQISYEITWPVKYFDNEDFTFADSFYFEKLIDSNSATVADKCTLSEIVNFYDIASRGSTGLY